MTLPLTVWDVASGRLLRTLEGHRLTARRWPSAPTAAGSPARRGSVATTTSPASPGNWCSGTPATERTCGECGGQNAVAFTPEGRLVSGSGDDFLTAPSLGGRNNEMTSWDPQSAGLLLLDLTLLTDVRWDETETAVVSRLLRLYGHNTPPDLRLDNEGAFRFRLGQLPGAARAFDAADRERIRGAETNPWADPGRGCR
jgi:hypothetical protein